MKTKGVKAAVRMFAQGASMQEVVNSPALRWMRNRYGFGISLLMFEEIIRKRLHV